MAIIGVITGEGLEKAQSARDFAGWRIVPERFAIATEKGVLSSTRTTSSMSSFWASGEIEKEDVLMVDDSTLNIKFRVPKGVPSDPLGKEIGEIYILGKDTYGSNYLLGLCHIVDREAVIKKTNDEIDLNITLIMKRKSEIKDVEINYAYDLGVSTTSAEDVFALLEAGDNVSLRVVRNQVEIAIASPWGSIAFEKELGGVEWTPFESLQTTLEPEDSEFIIQASGIFSSLGGGGSVRLVAYNEGFPEDFTTLDRRDYTDSVSGESFGFYLNLEGPGSTVSMIFELQHFSATNVTVNTSNVNIEKLEVTDVSGGD